MTGIGYDIHQMKKGRPLVLGGVRIPHSAGLLGHSDADALTHAIVDALLGAAGLGDIGRVFGTTRKEYKNAPSTIFLSRARQMTRKYRIVNVDSTVVAEKPILSPYIPAMQKKLASILGIPASRVSVKACSGNGTGAFGAKNAIAALAIVEIR